MDDGVAGKRLSKARNAKTVNIKNNNTLGLTCLGFLVE